MNDKIAEHIKAQNAIKDNFIARYLAATGARIEDTVLIEQTSADGFTKKYWCQPKEQPVSHVSDHYIEKCRHCLTVTSQCRCPAQHKKITWVVCDRCGDGARK